MTTPRDLAVRAIAALIASGWTKRDALIVTGHSPCDIKIFPSSSIVKQAARNTRMVTMYREGKTLEEIGVAFGVTRERARQILAAAGLSRMNGGASVRSEGRDRRRVEARMARAERSDAKREAMAQLLYGCDYQTILAINNDYPLRTAGSPADAFFTQRRTAQVRGVVWSMTFLDWWGVWMNSGKWAQRGRRKGCYCMARIGDAGAYAVGNVEIITITQNIRDGHATRGVNLKDRCIRAHEMREQGSRWADIAAEIGVSVKTAMQYRINGRRHVGQVA